ncbi:MAG: hypothetical protein ACPGO5_00185 [Patescibacteria group bacterium]
MEEAQGIYQDILPKLHQSSADSFCYEPEEWAYSIKRLREIEWFLRRYAYSDSVDVLIDSMGAAYTKPRYYVVATEDPLDQREISQRLDSFEWEHRLNEAFSTVQTKIEDPRASASSRILFRGIKKGYTRAFLFVFIIALVIFIPERGLRFRFSDVATMFFVVIAWPMFIWAYKPNNAFQRAVDRNIDTYTAKIGARGWRISVAYSVALIISIASFLRPSSAHAFEMKGQEVIMHVIDLEIGLYDIDLFDESQNSDSSRANDRGYMNAVGKLLAPSRNRFKFVLIKVLIWVLWLRDFVKPCLRMYYTIMPRAPVVDEWTHRRAHQTNAPPVFVRLYAYN